mgnify:FL=1|jgi:competence protein ComK
MIGYWSIYFYILIFVYGGDIMDYDINRDTVMIIPINDKKSRVIETNGDYIVDDNAYSIMERSCLYFGSSYEGRLLSSKSILGSVYKAPIVIEESRSIIFFPVKSSVVKQNIWISLNNLVSYNKHDKKTIITFKRDKQILLDIPYFSIDSQVLRSTLLESVIRRRKNEEKND